MFIVSVFTFSNLAIFFEYSLSVSFALFHDNSPILPIFAKGYALLYYLIIMTSSRIFPPTLIAEYESRIDSAARTASLRSRYKQLNAILIELLSLLTADAPYAMSGPYAQVEYVVNTFDPPRPHAIRRLRLHCRYPERYADEIVSRPDADIWASRVLVSLLTGRKAAITEGGSDDAKPAARLEGKSASPRRAVRVAVRDAGDVRRVRVGETDGEEEMEVDLSGFGYMAKWLRQGTVLSLVYFDGELDFVVYEPDFLVDATTVAACFEEYAKDHRLATLNSLMPNETTAPIILGNFAGQFLDESLADVRRGREPGLDYEGSARIFFRDNALSLATVGGIDSAWHEEARRQQANVASAVKALLSDGNFNPSLAATEVSLFGPAIGMQGRADLLQTDWRLLIEQKSGKWAYPNGGATLKHYVQMVVYKMMCSICYNAYNEKSSFYFLYSKYPQVGLLREGQNWPKSLAQEILELRNKFVHDKFRYTRPEALARDLLTWRTEEFRQLKVNERFWTAFVAPRYDGFFSSIAMAGSIERSYVFEMLAFLNREQLIGRYGDPTHARGGFSSLWTTAAADRVEAGEALCGLYFARMERDEVYDTDAASGERSILVLASRRCDDALAEPNFRPGDPIVLHDYPDGGEPDVCDTICTRATLLSVTPDGGEDLFHIKLHSASEPGFFAREGRKWAVEHDVQSSSYAKQERHVLSLLSTDKSRRDLILSRRRPIVEAADVARVLDHGPMNELVERQLQARELFLLVGPPGTGKTSMGLMSILREELQRPGHSVLLLSYTNRAVDEICSKLEKDGLDYIRFGQRFACANEYRHRLIQMCLSDKGVNAASYRQRLAQARIVVGTTSSIAASEGLFKIKRFDLSIVDEASQILEPSIIGIMTSMTAVGGRSLPSVGRFVLIGDERQLPAVVQQRREQSRVTDAELNKIGLVDCRDSFFERMIRLYGHDDALVYRLTRHGRMHPEVAAFCNGHFYGGTLRPIPLPHQVADLDLCPDAADPYTRVVTCGRVVFVNSHSDEPTPPELPNKVNPHEADIVARLAVSLLTAWRGAGRALEPDKTLGVIVPYRNQISAIRGRLVRLAQADPVLADVARRLTIDTVERLQGSERDVIIYGFTVSRASQLEFLKDSQYVDGDGRVIDRKLNVALSRARDKLIVVGDKPVISTVPLFEALVSEMPCVDL